MNEYGKLKDVQDVHDQAKALHYIKRLKVSTITLWHPFPSFLYQLHELNQLAHQFHGILDFSIMLLIVKFFSKVD